MRNQFPYLKTSRRSLVVILLATVIVGGWLVAPEGRSQALAAVTPNASLNVLLLKLKSQQDAMVANQTKIEAQTALLREDIRQAKIYAARSGAGRR